MTAAERATLQQLRHENQALRAQVAALEQTVHDLLDQNRQLQEKLDEQTRATARQAAPFRRRQSRKVPDGSKKRPGRPLGHPGVHRAVPDRVELEKVPVPDGHSPEGTSAAGVAGSNRSPTTDRKRGTQQ